jgi:hypothetical protein
LNRERVVRPADEVFEPEEPVVPEGSMLRRFCLRLKLARADFP